MSGFSARKYERAQATMRALAPILPNGVRAKIFCGDVFVPTSDANLFVAIAKRLGCAISVRSSWLGRQYFVIEAKNGILVNSSYLLTQHSKND